MITIKLNNGTTFEATTVTESLSSKENINRQVNIQIDENIKEIADYEALLNAEHALDIIEATNIFGTLILKGFTEVRSIDRSIGVNGLKIRINLAMPIII